MAVKIRLKRMGAIRSPHYRIVVMDSRKKRDGRAIEEIGLYHPKNDPSFIQVDSERAQYWLSVGAQPTEAVVAIFKRSGDWQKFSGEDTPAGIDPQAEKPNKTEIFNKALANSAGSPTVEAFTSKKADAKESAPAEDEETATEATTETPAAEAEAGDAEQA
ncbi:MAG TPA: 30S ribosomal protein S16 [Propionibacterium sp.]|nr:30S ribosomal protein S16 [Propionibacterium sp.]